MDQMRNVLRQIITLYPTDNIEISMESGNNVSGRPGSLFPAPNTNPNAGLFQLVNAQGSPRKPFLFAGSPQSELQVPLIIIPSPYLPTPSPAPTGCGADCQAAIRAYLPAGTTGVDIKAGGQTVANGTVKTSVYGMLVITGPITVTRPLFQPARRKFCPNRQGTGYNVFAFYPEPCIYG